MKKLFRYLLLATLIVAVAGSFAACVDSSAENDSSKEAAADISSEEPSDKLFYATVTSLTSDFGGILVKPESPMLAEELVVHATDLPKLSVGDRIKVVHDGQIALSYPGQVFGAVVTLVE